MKLTTPIKIHKADLSLSHFNKLLLVGSCFSNNIGERLASLKFDSLVNPFGIIYNPVSIAGLLQRIIHLKEFTIKDIYQNNELCFSFEHHSLLNSLNDTKHLKKINKILTEAHFFLKNTDVLIITLGTAFVYRYKNTKQIVANCHKVPNSNFEKSRLSLAEIFTTLNLLLLELFQFNNNISVVFTVSPVRHVKDGLVNNTKSKAVLHLAVEQLIKANKEECSYFPAYEIMMDDLRDYRFYKNDLLHPSTLAIDYIWQQFVNTYCNETTSRLIKQINGMLQQYNHKPFNANTESHKIGLKNLIGKMQQFQSKNKIYFKKEIEDLKNKVNFAE